MVQGSPRTLRIVKKSSSSSSSCSMKLTTEATLSKDKGDQFVELLACHLFHVDGILKYINGIMNNNLAWNVIVNHFSFVVVGFDVVETVVFSNNQSDANQRDEHQSWSNRHNYLWSKRFWDIWMFADDLRDDLTGINCLRSYFARINKLWNEYFVQINWLMNRFAGIKWL